MTAEAMGESAGENRGSSHRNNGWARWRRWLYPLVTVLLFSLAFSLALWVLRGEPRGRDVRLASPGWRSRRSVC